MILSRRDPDSTKSKYRGDKEKLQPVPEAFPWLVLFSSGDCTSVCATESTCYCYFVIPVEASPIEPVASDNQRDDYYEYNYNDANSCSMLLYLLQPRLKL